MINTHKKDLLHFAEGLFTYSLLFCQISAQEISEGKGCAVAVSGVAEPVPCTGISLDKSELTFTEAGTRTLTATVTPEDTTDALTWESSNANVATVENGTVTAVANGSATITARCGNQSAECVVAVSGIATPYPLENGVATITNIGAV